jgi:ribosomal protein L37AE/L43A
LQTRRLDQGLISGVVGTIISFTFGPTYGIILVGRGRFMVRLMEKVTNHECPRCGRTQLNVYFSDQTDNRVGAWCEFCNLKAYYFGERLVPINS